MEGQKGGREAEKGEVLGSGQQQSQAENTRVFFLIVKSFVL